MAQMRAMRLFAVALLSKKVTKKKFQNQLFNMSLCTRQ